MLVAAFRAAAARALELAAERVDRTAAAWLLARGDLLPRYLTAELLERLAERAGAKLETTETP